MPSSTFLNLPAEKQEKLLEAATREFSHRPFNEASINQIIKEAGIPRGSFYMYFQDKEDLFRYLLKGYVDQLFMLLEEFLLRNGGDIFQALLDLYDYVQAKIDNQHLGEIGAMTGIIRCNSGMQKNGLLEMLDAETLLQRLGGAVNPDLLDLRQDRDLGDILGTLLVVAAPMIYTGLQAGVNHGSRHNQQCAQDVAQVPVLPQVQQVRIHRAAQALEKRFRIQHFQQPILLHPAVAADDSGHGADLSQVLIVDFCLHVIIQIQQRLKNVAAVSEQKLLQQHEQLIHISLQQIAEQVLLILKVHVKAAPGDACLLDDLVDGRLVERPVGKLPGGRLQQLLLLFRRQIQKSAARHAVSSSLIRNRRSVFFSAAPDFIPSSRGKVKGFPANGKKKHDNLSLIIADKLSYCKRELRKFTNISQCFRHFIQRSDPLIGLRPVLHRSDPPPGDTVLGGVAE